MYPMTYLFVFTLSTCILSHMILHHDRSLWKVMKNIRVEHDIHAKLMRNYPECRSLCFTA